MEFLIFIMGVIALFTPAFPLGIVMIVVSLLMMGANQADT